MSGAPSQEVSQLLAAWSDGDRSALDKMLPLVEGELQRLAHRYMSHERGDHTLQTTALVNEAYLKLIDQKVYASGVPEALEWIVSRALRKEKDARYQTANELLVDLKELKKKIEFAKLTGEGTG